MFRLFAFTLAIGAAGTARAQDEGSVWSSRGEVALESRAFRPDQNPATRDRALAMLGRLELRHAGPHFEQKVRGFGRMDRYDRDRSMLIPEEAWAQGKSERFRLRVGVDIVNWTATEAFHPVDVINARNWDSDLENLEKIGEPMLALQARVTETLSVTAMYLPVYTQPRQTSSASRLHFGLPGLPLPPRLQVDRRGRFTDRDFGHQGAINLRQIWGQADISIQALEHMDRTQPLVMQNQTGGPAPFNLVFQTVRQVGGTFQQAVGPVLIKIEGAYRHFVPVHDASVDPVASPVGALPDRDHGELAVGLEYGLIHRGSYESTLLLEGQTMLGVDAAIARQLTPFQRDILAGYRFAFNDEDSKEFFLGAIADVMDGDQFLFTASYQQRLGESWTVRAGARVFVAPHPSDPLLARGLQAFRNAEHLRLTLTRHF